MERETDEIIFERYLKTGNNDDLKELLARYREELCFFLFRMVRNMEDAEELMLDAYAGASSGRNTFEGRSGFKTWLFGIGRNLALKHLRKQHFFLFSLNEEITSGEGMPELTILKDERNRMLYEALDRINPDYRQALHLCYFENMSEDDIAVVLKKSKKQVYNLMARGKKALKETLVSMGFEAGL